MEVLKTGGIACKCTGHIGHGGLGCGAILLVNPGKDLFKVSSLATDKENMAFRCPECGATSDFEINQVNR